MKVEYSREEEDLAHSAKGAVSSRFKNVRGEVLAGISKAVLFDE